MENVINSIKKLSGETVLDVATGQGEFIAFMKDSLPNFTKMVGIDASEQILERAKKNFKDERIEFLKMDAYKMDFSDNSFDIVTISNSLHHFEKAEKILAEMKRVSKKNGKIIIHEMVSDNLNEAQKSHKKLHHWSAKIDMLNSRFHAETYTKQALIDFVKDNLKIDDLQVMSFIYPVKDNKDKKMIEHITGYFDIILKRAEGFSEYNDLKKEAEKIKAHIIEHGYEPATFVFIICENK
jgi:ubiquinone/menaquinone biosynthesis C-methylase UbiE